MAIPRYQAGIHCDVPSIQPVGTPIYNNVTNNLTSPLTGTIQKTQIWFFYDICCKITKVAEENTFEWSNVGFKGSSRIKNGKKRGHCPLVGGGLPQYLF